MSITVYPVLSAGEYQNAYRVKVNGTEVPLNTARVSAMPFNRRWPGHQRSQEQSERISFLSMASDECLTFEIFPQVPFDRVQVRPLSLGIEPQISEESIRFTCQAPAYFTVEPYGRREALHIFIDPPMAYDLDTQNEKVLYFGPGEHHPGLIRLESDQTLFLDAGAVVYGCVEAVDAQNIKILGRGILDNSENREQLLYTCSQQGNTTAVNNAFRRHTIQLEYCTGVQIEGITIRDSLVYNIRPVGCEDLQIRNVKIIGCWRYNSDGIDMHNCRRVLIENCFLRTFDDSICVKGFDCYYDGDVEEAVRQAMYRDGKAYDVFEDAIIRRCVIWNDWGRALEIGAETRAERISNIRFEDCDIIHVTGPVLDCCNVDYAVVEDVVYRDIRVEYDDPIPKPVLQMTDDQIYENPDPDYAPYLISVMVSRHPEYSAGGTRRGTNRRLLFENIRLYGRQMPRLRFAGYDAQHPTENVTVRSLWWNDAKITQPQQVQWQVKDHAHKILLDKI